MSIPLPRVFANAFFRYAGFTVVVALLFGGGARQGLWSDAVAEILALPLLGWALFRLVPSRLDAAGRWGMILVCVLVAVPLLQLFPLPPSIWAVLPDRNMIASTYDAAGIARPWLPLSLAPSATWRALLSLIPAMAVFLSMLSLDGVERRKLLTCVLFIALMSVAIGFLQIMGAAGLYFYAITNEGMAVGLFANGNHNATFLAAVLPFAVARLVERYSAPHFDRLAVALAGVLVGAIVVGIAIVGSRAGLGLGFLAGLFSIAIAYRAGVRARGRILAAGAGVFLVGVLIAAQFGAIGWQKRDVQDRDFFDDLRWPVAAVTLRAAQKHLPFGSGFGTFVPVYNMNAPRTDVFERYVNHAHNDWLELSLEGGLPALAGVAAFLGWFAWSSLRAWGARVPPGLDVNLARAGSIMILLIMMHSVVDYPLRSISIMIVFAMTCGFLIKPVVKYPAPKHSA